MARRLECLDGLRGLLAFYVLITHMAAFTVLPAGVTRPFGHGGAAVDLFFVLSGMVIVRSLESFDGDRVGFLLARAWRTMPAFLVVFACATAVQPLPTPLPWMPWIAAEDPARAVWSTGWPQHWVPELGAHLVMAHGLIPDGALPGAWISFLGAAWSLSTEWQFYLVAALLAPVLGRRAGARGMAWWFIALAAGGLAWAHAAPPSWQFSRAFLPNKAEYFALGIASAAWIADRHAPGAARPPGAARLIAAARLGIVLAVTLAFCWVRGGPAQCGAPLVWVLCLAAQRAVVRKDSRILERFGQCLRAPPLRRLGALSYCIYLVNEPVQKLLGLVLAPLAAGNAALFSALWIPGAILLPLYLAAVLRRRIEQPALRAGRHMVGRPAVAFTLG